MDAGAGAHYSARTAEEVFRDFRGRRAGMIKALTNDVEKFYQLCDPEKENLCLYGYPNETWELTLPAEEVPPEIPEPALGINFARDGMNEKDWLALVAVHSDSWLLAVAFYFAARFGFDKEARRRLFNMINNLPTIFEVVTGAAKKQNKEKAPNSTSKSNKPSAKMPSRPESHSKATKVAAPLKDDDESGEEYGEEEERDNTLCGSCGTNNGKDEFWICCDSCEGWYHGIRRQARPATTPITSRKETTQPQPGGIPDPHEGEGEPAGRASPRAKGEPSLPPPPMAASPPMWVALVLAALLAASGATASAAPLPSFAEAPEYRNGEGCPAPVAGAGVCDPGLVHIAMTLDAHYLRGSMAAIYSLLKHASCPESLFFHFVAAEGGGAPEAAELRAAVAASFPSLRFEIYPFRADAVAGLISASVRAALEAPLNYARNYLADLLPRCVPRTIYLDSDVLAVDDVRRLWETRLPAAAVVAAPEYCHANFTRYFTEAFWSDPELGDRVFAGRRRAPCYFNTGVMVIDLRRWRVGNYRRRIERWMEMQKEKRIYELGSLPPFLLVFAGEVEAVDHRWNQHGLGGDNVLGSCRPLHKGPVSLMHWSGKGKPWDRLDAGKPCPLDHTWKSYDLYIGENDSSSASAPSRSALSSSALPAAVFSW